MSPAVLASLVQKTRELPDQLMGIYPLNFGTYCYLLEHEITAAMQARAQGTILVECAVQTTGVCTNIRVERSFDPPFGLDEQAMKAAAEWRFRPAMRRGQPVPVLVTMEIAFALR